MFFEYFWNVFWKPFCFYISDQGLSDIYFSDFLEETFPKSEKKPLKFEPFS